MISLHRLHTCSANASSSRLRKDMMSSRMWGTPAPVHMWEGVVHVGNLKVHGVESLSWNLVMM